MSRAPKLDDFWVCMNCRRPGLEHEDAKCLFGASAYKPITSESGSVQLRIDAYEMALTAINERMRTEVEHRVALYDVKQELFQRCPHRYKQEWVRRTESHIIRCTMCGAQRTVSNGGGKQV